MFSKNLVETISYFIVAIIHFVSLSLNGSFGPIVGFIAFFIFGLIYFIIHKRTVVKKFGIIFMSFISIFAIFDYVPKLKDLKEESSTTIEKLVGASIVALSKIGIIEEEDVKYDELAPGSGGYGRFYMWKRTVENIKEFPLFGTGVGSWKSYNPDMPNHKPHNEFLQYGATAGIPCLIAYLSLIIYMFVKFLRKHKHMSENAFIFFGALLVYLVQSFFGNVMPFTAPLFFVLIGLAIKEIDFKTEKIDTHDE